MFNILYKEPVSQHEQDYCCPSMLILHLFQCYPSYDAIAASQPIVIPPLTLRICPLTHPLLSLARKAVAFAISSGVPRRLKGLPEAIILSISSLLPLKNSSVPVGPGAIALTTMPFRPRSFASTRVICSTAPLEVL